MAYDLHDAWECIEKYLSPNDFIEINDSCELKKLVTVLQDNDVSEILIPWVIENFKESLNNDLSPAFWNNFYHPLPEGNIIHSICSIFQTLYDNLTLHMLCFDRLAQMLKCSSYEEHKSNDNLSHQFRLLIKAIIFPNVNQHFQDAIFAFYTCAFRSFEIISSLNSDDSMKSIADESGEEAKLMSCRGCDKNRDQCVCSDYTESFNRLNSNLRELGLLEHLTGEAVSSIIHKRIKNHIENICKGNFEEAYLEILEDWLQKKVVGWLEALFGEDVLSSSIYQKDILAYRDRLHHFLYTTYAETRIGELFNIIVEFPESCPTLYDLSYCLCKTDLRGKLVESLKNALETRLLHPGVNTSAILTAYISAIRALRVLDPTGVLLELVCEPVRSYLRCREDTVRCIVSSLTEDCELSDELVKGQPLTLNESGVIECDPDNWESWMPDPVDADPAKMSSNRNSADIISMLVNIYGSKELFVLEYRTLLADRILTSFNYNTEKEIRYLELLKLRFGESQLHLCEVMLKDVADSKRINTHIVDNKKKELLSKMESDTENESPEVLPINSMILSAEFWPTFREEKMKLPSNFEYSFEQYKKSFEALKGNRTLNWKTHLGLVNIEIELKDQTLEMHVSPVHAIILWQFQEKEEWSIDDLSSVMQMSTVTLRRKIAFWQGQGLLRETSTDHFVLVQEQKGKTHEVVIVEEDEAESAMASASDQREEDMQVRWSYIIGMLTNLECMPLERIHAMLKMFALQGTSSECSQGELKYFLDQKVREEKLCFSSGVYRLPKPES